MAELIGYLLALNAIITWGLASLVYKFGLGKTEAKANLFFRLVIVSCSTFIISIFFGNYHFLFILTTTELIWYILMALLSGVSVTIGDLLYFFALKKIDASRAYPLTQLSLVFVYPLAFLFFQEQISLSVLIGGLVILSSVLFLSKKDKPKESAFYEVNGENNSDEELISRELLLGVIMAIGTALFWAIAIVSFNQARIYSNDVFTTNFFRILFGTISVAIVGIFDNDFFSGFKKENRINLKYFAYIGIAGSLSLGLADSFFYKAAEINGLVLTSTITANTPMVQQIFSLTLLKEKFRKRFIFAVALIIIGNYIILFL
ncbi:MAG: EamA family transporter [Candidatus Lokiarchaeota archaeon]|nr:EamA family transporter [Candidatus Lokiarchaeota archaeon]